MIHVASGVAFAFPYVIVLTGLNLPIAGTIGLGALIGFVHGFVMSFLLIAAVAEKHPLEQFQGTLDVLAREYPENAAQRSDVAETPGQHVVHHRHPLNQIELLENHADVPAQTPELARAEGKHVGSVEPNASGRGIMPQIDLSSSEIRSRAAAGKSIRYQVPRAVEKYIETHKLYR